MCPEYGSERFAACQYGALSIIVKALPVRGFPHAFEQQRLGAFVDGDQVDAIFIEQVYPVGAAGGDPQVIAPDFFRDQVDVQVHHGWAGALSLVHDEAGPFCGIPVEPRGQILLLPQEACECDGRFSGECG